MRTYLSNDKEAKCPFFRAHGADFIRCEGDVPDTATRIEFLQNDKPDKAAKRLHYRVFCCKRWRNCEHAMGVKRKYDDE